MENVNKPKRSYGYLLKSGGSREAFLRLLGLKGIYTALLSQSRLLQFEVRFKVIYKVTHTLLPYSNSASMTSYLS